MEHFLTFDAKSLDLADFNNFASCFSLSKIKKTDSLLKKLFQTPEIRKIAN